MSSVSLWCAFAVGDGRAVIERVRIYRTNVESSISAMDEAIAYLESLGVSNFAVSIPEGVTGNSLGLPLVLGALAVEYGWSLPPDVLLTGAVTRFGEIDPVGYVPEKMQAAGDFGLKRFIYPSVAGDLHEPYARRIEMTRRSLRNLRCTSCRTVEEAVRLVIRPIDRLVSFLTSGHFGEAGECEKALSEFVREGDRAAVSQLLETWLSTGGNPVLVGRVLYGALLSVPTVVRQERFTFPLLDRRRLLELTASFQEKTSLEPLLLANEGRFTFEESVSEYFRTRSEAPIESLADFLWGEMAPLRLLAVATGPIDDARATFSLDRSQVDSADEMWDVLQAFATHVSRLQGETHLVCSSLVSDLKGLFQRVFPDEKVALELGLRGTLDRLTEGLKDEAVSQRWRTLTVRAVAPLSMEEEAALACILGRRCGLELTDRDVDWDRLGEAMLERRAFGRILG